MTLRLYQQDCLTAIAQDIDLPGNSLAVLPTGAGKSHIIAAAALLRRPVLILVPSQELLKQNMEKLSLLVDPNEIGVYSASFNKKEIKTFTFATIQSVFRKPELFKDVKLIIIDECHQLSPRNMKGMSISFINALPGVKVLGLTATPFRTEMVYEKIGNDLYAATGIKMINRMYIEGTKKPFWNKIIYTKSHRELVEMGYLMPLRYVHDPLLPYESIQVNVSHSDFNLEAYSQAVIGFESNILRTIAEAQMRFKSVLVFCSDVGQANRLSEIVKGSAVVTGETPKKKREGIIEDFKNHTIKTVFNVGCLTVGFDHPALDCIVLLRPVRSPILYLQILGRLTRPAQGKTPTIVDLTGSCKALGEIESFEVFLQHGLWNVRSNKKVDGFHGKLLFRQKI